MDEVIQAAARVLVNAALDLIQADPHQWSQRPCATCNAVSAIIGKPFGCKLYGRSKDEVSRVYETRIDCPTEPG